MPNPNVSLIIQDGALGSVPASPANTFAVFGPSASGDANLPTVFGGQPGEVVTEFGYGPGPSLVAALVASGIAAYFVKVPTDSPGAAGSVVHAGTGLSMLTVTGTPFDRYDVVVTVTRSGVAGADDAPAVTVSFDGGASTLAQVRIPTSRSVSFYSLQTGLTLTFSASTLVAGDTYVFSCSAPTVASSDVAAAIDAFRDSKKDAALGYCVGEFGAEDAAVISGAVAGLFQTHLYTRFFVESVDILSTQTEAQWKAALQADFADFEDDRVAVPAGYALVLDPVTRFSLRRNVGFLAAVRAGTTSVGTDAIRTSDGPLVPFAGASSTSTVFYSELPGQTGGLGDSRFYVLQSYRGLPGYFVAQPRLMSGPTSDFRYLTFGRVMDEASRVADVFFTGIVGTGFRVSRKTGFILPADRLNIEQAGTQREQVALVTPGDVSDVWVTVNGDQNVLSTERLDATVSIVPLFYPRQIDVTMTFNNPAITAV